MSSADKKLVALEDALEEMILEDVDITARAVVRRIPDIFKSATALTRDNPQRLRMIEEAKQRQIAVRALHERANPKSRSALSTEVADLKVKLAQVEAERDLLIASHRALIRAVGEQGLGALHRFYSEYVDVETKLRELGAIASAKVIELPEGDKK